MVARIFRVDLVHGRVCKMRRSGYFRFGRVWFGVAKKSGRAVRATAEGAQTAARQAGGTEEAEAAAHDAGRLEGRRLEADRAGRGGCPPAQNLCEAVPEASERCRGGCVSIHLNPVNQFCKAVEGSRSRDGHRQFEDGDHLCTHTRDHAAGIKQLSHELVERGCAPRWYGRRYGSGWQMRCEDKSRLGGWWDGCFWNRRWLGRLLRRRLR